MFERLVVKFAFVSFHLNGPDINIESPDHKDIVSGRLDPHPASAHGCGDVYSWRKV